MSDSPDQTQPEMANEAAGSENQLYESTALSRRKPQFLGNGFLSASI